MRLFVFTLQFQLQKLLNCHQVLITPGFEDRVHIKSLQSTAAGMLYPVVGVTLMSSSSPNHVITLQNHIRLTSWFTFPTEFPIYKTQTGLSCKILQLKKKKGTLSNPSMSLVSGFWWFCWFVFFFSLLRRIFSITVSSHSLRQTRSKS